MARILIVDDDPDVRQFLGRVLTASGHQYAVAENGAEAVRYCQSEPVDLVICDIFMPRMTGLDTIPELRHQHPHLKILAVTGGYTATGKDKFLRTARLKGANASLQKPFGATKLTQVIDQLLTDPSEA